MDTPAKRERHRRFWGPLTKGEGGYVAVQSPIDDSGEPPYKIAQVLGAESPGRKTQTLITVELANRIEQQRDEAEALMSVERCLERAEASAANRYYGLDAINSCFVNFGPGVHAALLGAPYIIQAGSVWFDMDPPIKNWDRIPDLITDTGHELYKAILAQTRALCATSKNRYAVSYTDIGGQYDVLFSLRGEELLSDFIEYPDIIKAAEERLDDEFIKFFNSLTDIIAPSGCGYSGWIPVVSDVPWYPLQCDMSVMISAKMFGEFVLPSLDKVSSAIGRAIYHLDGPEEIRHLDMLLSLKHVHAIQWVPLPTMKYRNTGSYVQDFADEMSLDVYRRSLAAGKKVVLLGVRAEQVQPIFDAVGCDGVFIQTNIATRKEADEFAEYAAKRWLR